MAKKKKRKLTPLQLHKIRVRAGKKAAKTIKKRMKTDPEFREHMQDVYRKSGERLKQYNIEKRKRKEFDDYIDNIPDIEDEDYTDEETMEEYDNDVSEDELEECQIILSNISDIVMNGVNPEIGEFLMELIAENVPSSLQGKRDYVDRIKNSKDELLDRAEKVAYNSGKGSKGEVRENAHAIAKIIAPNGYDNFELDKCIEEDFDYITRYRKIRREARQGNPHSVFKGMKWDN